MINCCSIPNSQKVSRCGLLPSQYQHNGFTITKNQAKKLISKGDIFIKRNKEKIHLVLGIDLTTSEKNAILQNY